MKLRPIKTELDYQNALKQIEKLFDAEPKLISSISSEEIKNKLIFLGTYI